MGIVIVGDCMLGRGVTPYVSTYGVTTLLEGIAPIMRGRIGVTNLETPLCDTASTEVCVAAPRFRAPTAFASQLRDAGIAVVNLANNHMFDCGVEGFAETTAALDAAGIQWFGAGRGAAEAYRPAIVTHGGKRIGFLGGSYRPTVGVHTPGVADCYAPRFLDAIRVVRASVDVLLVFVHAGIELLAYPLPREQQTYHSYVAAGADLVIGSHPHCVQVWETFRGTKIFYSIGDLLFDHFDDAVWDAFHREGTNVTRYASDVPRARLRESIILTIATDTSKLHIGVHGAVSAADAPRPRLLTAQEHGAWRAAVHAWHERFERDGALRQRLAAIDHACQQRRAASV